ncbi:MAG: DUF6261 family protein [Mediterranea sp.]|nr:DUF6261 family protein [Mediterranea sp.]
MLECSTLLLEKVYTPETVKAVGIGMIYDELVTIHGKYAGILKRNPASIKTEPLTKSIARVRRLMGAFGKSLQVASAIEDSDLKEALKRVISITEPYLKTRRAATRLALLGDAGDMCQALSSTDVAEKVSTLGLSRQVDVIKKLVNQCNTLLCERGDEKEHRRLSGSATKARATLRKKYRQLFKAVIPGLYLTATDAAVRNKIVEIVNRTNATLNSFRHLTTNSIDN